MTEPKTHTLDTDGAVITYYVRASESSTEPPLLVVGGPMDAAGFVTLAGHFADRTVISFDPRGAGQSRRTDGAARTTPDENADDLHRVLNDLGVDQVDVFATSGGAVTALVLTATHPEQVRTLVAHEPPASQEVSDREVALAACTDIRRTYEAEGFGPAMAKFIALVMHSGELPSDYAERPAPDPAAFGLPTTDDGSRDDALMANIIDTNHYKHDFDRLRAVPTRIIVAVGAESTTELAARGGIAVAGRLGIEPTTFPSDHAGYAGGEYGMTGKPDEFAAKLREVLAEG